ncbi:MAG: cobalamin biosynthesis protein CobD [Lachnospiraceae bacterium]|nr:cobalamin biosynthesis protein CobD [Lachnospiraceae bacterium]
MREFLAWHMIALFSGCALDLLIGDPHGIPHPVAAIGKLIYALERRLFPKEGRRDPKREYHRGIVLSLAVVSSAALVTAAVMYLAYRIHPYAGIAAEAVLTCYILAAKSLYKESMKVYADLRAHDLEKARRDLSMIVGRDTDSLDSDAVTRAAVETVAENTSDGVLAPLIYTALGGPVLGMIYKSVNTMDSMVGYRNDRYEFFGKAAAKLDDAVNYLPSRMSALLIIGGTALVGACSGTCSPSRAFRIWRRDRRNHKSPNSAQTESACAGALGLKLGGNSVYQGILVEKPTIGDAVREIEPEDIRRANHLMFAAEAILLALIMAGFSLLYVMR